MVGVVGVMSGWRMRGGGDVRHGWRVRHGGEAWLECCRCYESHPCWMTERR